MILQTKYETCADNKIHVTLAMKIVRNSKLWQTFGAYEILYFGPHTTLLRTVWVQIVDTNWVG